MRPLFLALTLCGVLTAADPRPYFYEPSVSPDGTEIAFVSGGDIWTVPSSGGEARLLVSDPATESRPLYSADGKRLAFASTRTGNGDIYVLTFATGELKRLTWDDAVESAEAWSRDGQWIYFSSNAREIAGYTDIYRVKSTGGTPMAVTADSYTTEYFAAPSPDGQTLAFNGHGNAGAQWWRKGHSHLDESEIWLLRNGSYQRFTEPGAKQAWAMWAADGRSLFYMSDRSGAQNIWQQELSKPNDPKPKQLTKFTNGRVLWPSISADGKTMVFERDFEIWKLDPASGRAAAINITRRGAPAGPGIQHVTLGGQFQQMALSPDGRKVALIAHGEVFAGLVREGSEAQRITRTTGAESQVTWASDSRRIAYVSERNGRHQIFLYDFGTNTETQLTAGQADNWPRFSPDGKMLAFLRDSKELRILDIATKQDRLAAEGHFEQYAEFSAPAIAWSPDGHWIAYNREVDKAFTNTWVVEAAGGSPQPVSFLANMRGDGVTWSSDGKQLFFVTGQRMESGFIARVDLQPRTPQFREAQFNDLFKADSGRAIVPAPDAKPVDTGVKIDFEGLRQRLALLPIGLDIGQMRLSPDGKTLAMVAISAGQQNVYSYSVDELAREAPVARQLTTTAAPKDSLAFSPDSRDVYYLAGGNVFAVNIDSRNPRPIGITAEMDVDFGREKLESFEQAWTRIRDYFFDAKFNGVDWASVRATYEPLVAAAATPDELRRLLNLMVGELNASHMGANPPGNATRTSSGRIGLRFDREQYEQTGKLKISSIVPLSPAAVAGVKVGDEVQAIDAVPVAAGANADSLFDFKIGKRLPLQLADRTVEVLPVNLATEKELVYRDWVEKNRNYVSRVSNGRLGYVHMRDMSEAAINRLYIDLDVENHTRAGVVVDLRNNNGGFVNPYAIDVFSRQAFLKMKARDREQISARAGMAGQRALEAPTILMVNQHSLSDAEDFAEGYRALKLGKIVGEPTAGWIIYTSNFPLLDGTVFRLPATRVQDLKGEDMELHPRPVDVTVSRALGDSTKDAQLDTAVKELLAQLPPK